MSREWKPGDVAMVTDRDGVAGVAVVRHHNDDSCPVFVFAEHPFYKVIAVDNAMLISDARPLVVIDPESDHDVAQVESALEAHGCRVSTNVQAALRSLVTPPRPEEPLGLGAVVEDEDGVRWVRCENADLEPHWYARNKRRDHYADIAVVRVLSEGVTA